MAKNKLIKNVTIDELAEIINNGFDGQMEYMGKEFGKIGKDIDILKKDLKEVKTDLKETIKRTDKLETRMDYVENILDLPAKNFKT